MFTNKIRKMNYAFYKNYNKQQLENYSPIK